MTFTDSTTKIKFAIIDLHNDVHNKRGTYLKQSGALVFPWANQLVHLMKQAVYTTKKERWLVEGSQ